MRSRVWTFLTLLGLVVLAGCSGSQARGAAPATAPGELQVGQVTMILDETSAPPQVGEPAPNFGFELNGQQQRLSDLRGKRVLINFWATWCGPCALEMPDIQRVAQTSPDLVVLGLNLKQDAAAVREFAQQRGLRFPLLVDPEGEVAGNYGVVHLPMSYFIDTQGQIAYRHLGALTESQIRQELEKIP